MRNNTQEQTYAVAKEIKKEFFYINILNILITSILLNEIYYTQVTRDVTQKRTLLCYQ